MRISPFRTRPVPAPPMLVSQGGMEAPHADCDGIGNPDDLLGRQRRRVRGGSISYLTRLVDSPAPDRAIAHERARVELSEANIHRRSVTYASLQEVSVTAHPAGTGLTATPQ